MKKFYYLIFLAIGVSGCSVESIDSTEVLFTADAKVKLTEVQDPMGIYAGPNLKGVISVTHDCDNLYVKLTPNGADPDDVKLGIFQGANLPSENGYSGEMQYNKANGVKVGTDWIWTFNIEAESYDPKENLNIFFTAWGGDWIGTSTLGSKPNAPNYHVFNFDFTSLDCDACEESFSYTTNADGSYTFTYIPAENMSGAEVVFTFAQSVVASGYDWPNWNGKSSTRTESMDFDACSVYNWTVFLEADCSGKSGESNVWTDFKVNEASKKNDNTPNLTQSCD